MFSTFCSGHFRAFSETINNNKNHRVIRLHVLKARTFSPTGFNLSIVFPTKYSSPGRIDHSEILMVDVATSMPVFPEEVLSSEAAEDDVVGTPVHSGEMAAVQVLSETSVHVDLGCEPKHHKAEPPLASSFPLQDEQEPPAHSQAPQAPLQAAIEVPSTTHRASICKDEPVIEGVTNVEQILEQTVTPFSDQAACLKGNEQSPPLSPILVVGKTASHVSEKSVGSANFVQLESAKCGSSVHVEADGSATTVSSEISVHLEVDIFALAPGSAGQEDSWENRASQETEVKPALSGEAAQVVRSGASVRSITVSSLRPCDQKGRG